MSVLLSNGLTIPSLGLGTWKVARTDAADAVYNSIVVGYRHIDCAHIYGNEKEVGAGLKRAFDEGIVKREDLWITSKLWNDDHADVAAACKVTLSNLGLDYLDLYLIHWPTHWVKNGPWPPKIDTGITMESTWRQMEALVDHKLTRSIGVSNCSAAQVKEVYDCARIKPVMNQVESHPFFNQFALEKAIAPLGVKLTSYSAFNLNDPDPKDPVQERHSLFTNKDVVAIAAKHGKTPAQVLVRWHIDLGRCVIPKSIHVNRLKENFGALSFKLDTEDMEKLAALGPQIRGLNPYSFDGVKDAPFFKD